MKQLALILRTRYSEEKKGSHRILRVSANEVVYQSIFVQEASKFIAVRIIYFEDQHLIITDD